MKKYIEIGFGNRWFIRTELENDDGTETEIKGIVRPFHFRSVYLRIWVGKRVFIWDSKDGMKIVLKNRRALKFIIGVYGT
ncbi:DUF3977 family protein [Paenibacillus azoreducens]|uniref:DUF3977 family protein n=1 Tax=Paenibacillus azoreducens TaxID=116718 RepID=UPI0039F62E6B